MRKEIIVLGAGIVGVSTALALQLSGHQVQLLDRKLPGRETSFGNAGVLSDSSVYVFNNPGLLRALPGLIANRSNWPKLVQIGFIVQYVNNQSVTWHLLLFLSTPTQVPDQEGSGKYTYEPYLHVAQAALFVNMARW